MTPSRAGRICLLLLAATFFLLRFVHLTADYPHNIRWDDGIATDEGWYASSAINAHAWGTGLLPGDMNISVLMPVWPLIARLAFAVGGYNITSLRAVAVLFFLLDVALLCSLLRRYGAAAWIPLLLALAAVNPWSFAFSRSAFLEFPMVAFVLAAILAVPTRDPRDAASNPWNTARLLTSGVMFAVALLLKTTAVALLPVLVYTVFTVPEPRLSDWARNARRLALVFGGSALLYLPYWFTWIRPHAADVTFYLSVVKNTLRFTPLGFVADASRPFRYGLGSDHLLFPLTLLILPLSILIARLRTLWQDRLYVFAAVWLISFMGFMVKHNNDPARYFAVIIPAMFLLVVALLRNVLWSSPGVRHGLLALVILDIAVNTAQTTALVAHPRYSFRNAAAGIAQIMSHDSNDSMVVIGDNAHELALQAPLRPVNLLFHSASISEQMQRRNPGWWLQFSPIEDGRCFREVLSLAYTAERRGEWEIYYPGQKLTLWKLSPIPGKSLPKNLTSSQTAACSPPVYN